jgi:amino acid transporter
MLDLRLPSGLFFAITGVLLLGVSFSNPHAPMTDANVDLYAGAAMLAFGLALLGLARWNSRT